MKQIEFAPQNALQAQEHAYTLAPSTGVFLNCFLRRNKIPLVHKCSRKFANDACQ